MTKRVSTRELFMAYEKACSAFYAEEFRDPNSSKLAELAKDMENAHKAYRERRQS